LLAESLSPSSFGFKMAQKNATPLDAAPIPAVWERSADSVDFLKQEPQGGPHWQILARALTAEPSRLAPRPPLFWRAKRAAFFYGALAAGVGLVSATLSLSLAASLIGFASRAPGLAALDRGATALYEAAAAIGRAGPLMRRSLDRWLLRSGHPAALSEAFAAQAPSWNLAFCQQVASHPNFDPLARPSLPFSWARSPVERAPKGRNASPAEFILKMLAHADLAQAVNNKHDERVSAERVLDLARAAAVQFEAREIKATLREAESRPIRPLPRKSPGPTRAQSAGARAAAQPGVADETVGAPRAEAAPDIEAKAPPRKALRL